MKQQLDRIAATNKARWEQVVQEAAGYTVLSLDFAVEAFRA